MKKFTEAVQSEIDFEKIDDHFKPAKLVTVGIELDKLVRALHEKNSFVNFKSPKMIF